MRQIVSSRFIRNLVLDRRKFEKLLELRGKTFRTTRKEETLEISVPSFTVSETRFSSPDLEVSTTVCFMCLEANKPCGH